MLPMPPPGRRMAVRQEYTVVSLWTALPPQGYALLPDKNIVPMPFQKVGAGRKTGGQADFPAGIIQQQLTHPVISGMPDLTADQ